MMRLLFYSELAKALDCCAPEDLVSEPDCARCPVDRECGEAGQCWCSLEVMQQAKDAVRALMHDNARLRASVEKLSGGRIWMPVGQMEPADDVLVWIRRVPVEGHAEIVTGYIEDGRWYVDDCINQGGAVTHWMEFITPRAPEVGK